MTTWRIARLEEVAEVSAGNPAPQEAEDFASDGEAFVRMQDVGREHHTRSLIQTTDHLAPDVPVKYRLRRFPAGTLLIPKSGASVNLNHRALLGREAYVVSHLATVIPNKDVVDPEFLYYWSLTYDPRHQAQTTSLPSLPTSLIKAAPLPLPPLQTQRRIVDLLSRAEAIVRLRYEAKQKAQEIIPALFVDAFGDPTKNPKSWNICPLGELISAGPQNGLYKHKSAYGAGTPILRIDAFDKGIVKNIASLRRLRLGQEDLDRYALCKDDIVVNRVNSPEYLGKSALIPELAEPTVFESNMMRFRVDRSRVRPRFIIALLQTKSIRQFFLSKAKHAINQSSINQEDIKSLLVPVPPLSVQELFERRAALVESVERLQAHASKAAEGAFQALLGRTFSEGLAQTTERIESRAGLA